MSYSNECFLISSSLSNSRHPFKDENANGGSSMQADRVATLNNKGIACMNSMELSQASNYLERSLNLANEMTLSSSSMSCFSSKKLPFSVLPMCIEKFDKKKNHYIYQRDSYDEGMNSFSYPLTINDDNAKSHHCVLAMVMFNIGILHVRMNKEEDAFTYFQRALNMTEQMIGGQCSRNSNCSIIPPILHNIGTIQYRSGRYEEAIHTYDTALQLLQGKNNTMSSQNMLEISSTLNCLGVVHFHFAENNDTSNKAMEYYKESLTVRRSVSGYDCETIEVATTLNNIGRVYYLRGDHNESFEVYRRVLCIRRRLLGNDHIDVAATVYNIGQSHHQRGELVEAMELYQEFLSIVRLQLGSEHRDVASILKCMAQIHDERQQHEDAVKLYIEAIRVSKIVLGDHQEVANVMNKLGNLYFKIGNLDGAIKSYKDGLEVERAVFDMCHPNIVVTLVNIGQIHKVRKQYPSALQCFKQALEIQRHSSNGGTHSGMSNTLISIGLLYSQMQCYREALSAYQEALQIRRDIYGDDHLDVASTMNSIGLVLFNMELHEYSLQSFHESVRIRRECLGSDHRDVATVYYNIATVYLESGDDDEALNYYNETLRIERITLGENHSDVALTMQHIAHVHQRRGELDDAIELFTESLSIQKGSVELLHEKEANKKCYAAIAETLNHLGNTYLQRAKTDEMMKAYSESTRYLRAAGKIDDDLTISGLNFYGISKNHPECPAAA